MNPLDHKNLDLDVPYFANTVRYELIQCTFMLLYILSQSTLLETHVHLSIHTVIQSCGSSAMHKIIQIRVKRFR